MNQGKSTVLSWDESFVALERGITRLVQEASAIAALVVRGDGQLLTCAGGVDEPGSLAVLAAGSMAASGALLSRVEEACLPSVAIDGEQRSFFLQAIDTGAFLIVLFDRKCSLGLVKLRARRLVEEARPWVEGLRQRQVSVFEALEVNEIDALFAE